MHTDVRKQTEKFFFKITMRIFTNFLEMNSRMGHFVRYLLEVVVSVRNAFLTNLR